MNIHPLWGNNVSSLPKPDLPNATTITAVSAYVRGNRELDLLVLLPESRDLPQNPLLPPMDAIKSPSYNRALSRYNLQPFGGSHQKCQHLPPVFVLHRVLTT